MDMSFKKVKQTGFMRTELWMSFVSGEYFEMKCVIFEND